MERSAHPARTPVAGLAALASLAFLAGCGQPHASRQVFITMSDNSFSPPEMRVPVGTIVHFRNMGATPHDAIAVDSSWSTQTAAPGAGTAARKWIEIAFTKPGVYKFFCPYHGTHDGKQGMVGVVIAGDVPYVRGGDESGKLAAVERPTGVTRHVPQEYPNIQAAVDAARPGDLILVADGVYHEEVSVTTPSLTIRGTDRNKVVLDGEFQRSNGFLIFADAVAVENLTTQNYNLNGFLWSGVTGYRASYVSAVNNGDYGLYAFDSYNGVVDHSYGSGSPDAAFYIGGCYPCKTVLDGLVGEHSSNGYSGTNSGGQLYIINSVFRNNSTGIEPNTFDVEPNPPERETTIIGNEIVDNGSGVSIDGGANNLVERNLIQGNRDGVMLIAARDQRYYPAIGNTIRNNLIVGSRRVDIGMSGFGNVGNCFEGNVFQTTLPWGLELLQGCKGMRAPVMGDLHRYFSALRGRNALFSGNVRPSTDKRWQTQPHPGPQPQMPGGASAPVRPPVRPFETYPLNLDAIKTPAASVVALKTGGG